MLPVEIEGDDLMSVNIPFLEIKFAGSRFFKTFVILCVSLYVKILIINSFFCVVLFWIAIFILSHEKT